MGSDPRIHLAILEGDTPLIRTQKRSGSYGGVFEEVLHDGADTIHFPMEHIKISKYDVVEKMEYPDLNSIDAVLLTGSRKSRPRRLGYVKTPGG